MALNFSSWKNLSPFNNLLIIICLCLFVTKTHSLQLHQANATVAPANAYNQQLYLQQLQLIQNRFATDLASIQATFTNLNLQLNNTNISSSSQIIKLQQTLAQQTNALYNIETYLNVPFALKSCQCLNFTQKQQAQLQAQVANVTAQINILQARLNTNTSGNPYVNIHCPSGNCPVVNSLRTQILQLKAYASVMNSTVHSNCCNRTLYIFRDNLASYPFWIYGNTTYQNYTASLNKTANGSKIALCPATLPFVNVSTNQCFVCPPSLPLFNLSSRQCIPACSSNKTLMLNITSHECVINKTCNPGYYFNHQKQRCIISLGTSSRCPPSTPVWNGTLLQCQICPPSQPYFDIAIRSCRACTVNQLYDPFNRICYSKLLFNGKPCANGSAFNLITNKCESLQNVTNSSANASANASAHVNAAVPQPTSGIAASCPPYAPYWDQASLICSRCPTSKPYFDPKTSSCIQCPTGTQWNPVVRTCVTHASLTNCASNQYYDSALSKCINYPHCLVSQVFNNLTKSCQTITQASNAGQAGNIGSCPPSTPNYNPQTLSCQKCPVATPLYNIVSGNCSACPTGTNYDVTTNTCVNPANNCPSGTFFNSTTSACEPINCPKTKPIFNKLKKACQACPFGTLYNFITKVCQSPVHVGVVGVCPPNTPYWNPVSLGCQQCPYGLVLTSSNTCV